MKYTHSLYLTPTHHTLTVPYTHTHTQLTYRSGALEWPLLVAVYPGVSVEFGLRRKLQLTLRTFVSIATQ